MNKNFTYSTLEETYQRDEIFEDCYVPDCKRLIFRLYLYHRLTNAVTNKMSTSHFVFLILLFSICNSSRNVVNCKNWSLIYYYLHIKKEKKVRKTSCFLKQLTHLYVDNIIKESSKKQMVNYCKKRRIRPSSEALIPSGITNNNE